MNSREKILKDIVANKPVLTELTDWVAPKSIQSTTLVGDFEKLLVSLHSKVNHLSSKNDLLKEVDELRAQYPFVIDTIHAEGEPRKNIQQLDARSLESLDVAIIEGRLGVAENGAIWLTETNMLNRLLPFICKHLVLVIDAENIVADMHEAYKKIRIDEDGYGVFISGPSKTADIEQSLVIGAHGPLTLTVYIISNHS
ncbi:MAG: LUD domain-containing protein [Bacteroidetes bacterium]|nr:LUD domain-containing protein [Bacteroidota bacterium]